MRRYLLHMGYCGTRLRGIQKQKDELEERLSSVQGLVEKGLASLCPANTLQLCFSSRTDKGVHAVCNTAHVDLARKADGLFYDPNRITHHLNYFFKKTNADIRIHRTLEVPPTFHARHDAIARTYLYRIAVTPPSACKSHFNKEAFLPSTEINKIHLVRYPFDTESVLSACRMLEGVHDFATFGASISKSSYPRETTRIIHKISVIPGQPLLKFDYDPLASHLQFWDITVRGSSFLYKQVRRIVGVLVACAQGCISSEDIKYMLDNPSPQKWNTHVQCAPPDGLFLLSVHYPSHIFMNSGHATDNAVKQKTC
ncbi:tRNA pseudouridine synthase-like 1 isoform X2 [Panulirus ornatus]|uniref:tRNA pseudouridine synthase-like 1 isoform X2 n=1 Tax=Panulirus ornatus TaxID=150431 RepID=UPI003A8501EF